MRIALILVAVIVVSGCASNNPDVPALSAPSAGPAVVPLSSNPSADVEAAQIEQQLRIALASGGISPSSYQEIGGQIESLESRGYDVSELRRLLSQLTVGGREPESKQQPAAPETQPSQDEVSNKVVIWHNMENGTWVPKGIPPECPELVFQIPVDLDLVTSIIYPGQVRSGDFKPHGGFRTDGVSGPVEVTAPMEGYIWNAAKFTDEFGIHYIFDIQHPCGIMYRLGHLSAVPPKLEAIFNETKGFRDSRTFLVDPPVRVELGETIATDIQHGAGFDWGVYDLRKENEAAQDPAFREAHKDEISQAYHALCWLDLLPPEQESIVKSLPATDGISGKNSDYCK